MAPTIGGEPLHAETFPGWVLERCGIGDLSAYRATALNRRIPACLRALHVTSTEEARALLARRPELLETALGSLLIGVSSFFRDRYVFESLRELLPGVVARRGGVRVLAAGCSCGQELYSVAMLVAELGVLGRSNFVGVDFRSQALEKARAGEFHGPELEGLDSKLIEKYFVATDGTRFIIPELRSAVEWRRADLLAFRPEAMSDLVLFRNVAIYMTGRAARRLWGVLVESIAPGGILVTGKSERPPAGLPLVRLANSIYRRTSEA